MIIENINPSSRYLIRYIDKEGKREIRVISALDIYQARSIAINLVGGLDNLINCHRLYNPTFSEEQ